MLLVENHPVQLGPQDRVCLSQTMHVLAERDADEMET